jgi:hypothetical protein
MPIHPRAVRSAMPAAIEPMLPTLTKRPFSGSDWLFEPKLDGWRTICLHLIVKSELGFAYYLHGQPEPEGEPFVEVNPSIVPGEKWKASFLNWPEAEEAYQEFTRSHPIVIGDEQQKD